jgi:hypothetical protein
MRVLLIVIAIILVGVLIGWITFNKGPDQSTININTGAIRQDTKKAVESGANLLHRAGDKMDAEAKRTPDANTADANRETAPVTR